MSSSNIKKKIKKIILQLKTINSFGSYYLQLYLFYYNNTKLIWILNCYFKISSFSYCTVHLVNCLYYKLGSLFDSKLISLIFLRNCWFFFMFDIHIHWVYLKIWGNDVITGRQLSWWLWNSRCVIYALKGYSIQRQINLLVGGSNWKGVVEVIV